jgi:hypothetical protein
MTDSEKERLAAAVVAQHCAFEEALAGARRTYPTREFKAFADAVRRYVDATRGDKMIHRDVVTAVHGLSEFLQSERKRVPDEVLFEAERLECFLFLGYDPHFEGDEPPGL